MSHLRDFWSSNILKNLFVFASTQYIETVMIFHADCGSVEVGMSSR